MNTVLIKVLYERCGSWPQKCYGDGYSTGWLRHFIATRRYELFNLRSAEARDAVFPSDIWCKINKLLKYYEYQLTNVALIEGKLEGFKLSSWFLKIMKLVKYQIAKKCHDFNHCCRWLHHHSRGCHVRFYFNETVFNSDDLILKVF